MPSSPHRKPRKAPFPPNQQQEDTRPEAGPRRPQDLYSNSQLGVLLLMAMYATTVDNSSRGLVRHANGVGEGYSSFRYDVSTGPDLQGLVSTAGVVNELSSAPGAEDDDGQPPTGQAVSDEEEGQPSTSAGSLDASDFDERTADSYEEDAIEIEDDSFAYDGFDAPYVAATTGCSTSLTPEKSQTKSLSDLPPILLAQALEFLTLPEINAARRTAIPVARAAAWIAPQPFGTPSVTFVRCGWLSALPDPIARPHAPPTPFEWRCMNCAGYSSYHEACTVCGTNVRQAAARVFVGQLRKRHSAVALRHVLRLYAPSINVLHIESHSNREGYEKGAAWLYVDTPADAARVLELNKRVFFDADADGAEGFWYIEGDTAEELEECKQRLFDFASERKSDETRKRMCLPGQPLVAELPTSSMLSGASKAPLHTATRGLIPDGRGWFHPRQQQRRY